MLKKKNGFKLQGESSGRGKKRVEGWWHIFFPRKEKPFVVEECHVYCWLKFRTKNEYVRAKPLFTFQI